MAVEKKARRGRMWKNVGNERCVKWNVGVCYCQEARSKKTSGRCGVGKAMWEDMVSGNRNLPAAVLEQVRGNVDVGCGAQMKRKSFSERNHQNGLS